MKKFIDSNIKFKKQSLQKRIKLIPLKKMATTKDIARYIA